MDKSRKAYHEQVAESLIAQLKQGTAPWQKPWQSGDPLLSFPHNPTTQKRYRGINALYLMSQDYADPRWLTYKQAVGLGAQVRKGEKSTWIQYWKFTDERIKKDDNRKTILNSEGKPVKETVKLERPRVFYASVFNAEQIDNLPELIIDPPNWNPIERAELILQAPSAAIEHGEYDRAFYLPATDRIHLPHKHQFETPDRYYATALHELGHWTGHESRLNRDLAHPFGSEGYAREELRAEIASMLLGHELGIGHDPGQHVAYVASWIKALEEDPTEIFRAAADAEKIQVYVMAFARQQELVEQEAIKMDEIRQNIATYTANLAPDLATVAQHNNRQLQKLIEHLPTQQQNALYLVADALKFCRNLSIDNLEFEETSQDKLGLSIPADWNGRVQIQGNVIETNENDDGKNNVVPAKELGIEPEFFGLYAQRNDQTWAWVADFDVQQQAVDTAEKLVLINAMSERNEYEKAVKLARIDELRIRNNPRSTEEEIDVAKAQRKHAEALAMQNDADFNKRRQTMETDQTNTVQQNTDESIQKDRNQHTVKESEHTSHASRQYLAVPYSEKDQAKAAGARWDKVAKAWYVGENADIRALQRWLPENVTVQQNPAIDAQTEFATVLRDNGCIVDGNHPVMDGLSHRIKVEGDRPGEKSGFYVVHMDGHPAGYFNNHRTKVEIRWKAKGYSLTEAQKAAFAAQVAIKQQERKAGQQTQYVKVAEAVKELLAIAPPANADHPYLQDKNARPNGLKVVPHNTDGLPQDSIVKICQDRQEVRTVRDEHPDSLVFVVGDLLLPIYDTQGKLWSAQTIQPNGTKLFVAGSQKEGHFHVVSGNSEELTGLAQLDKTKAIIIAEGYSTADTVSQAMNCPVVAAFDSGNLIPVAQQLHDKYPNKPIVIAGDDDQHLIALNGKNTGREKAQEAAQQVNGIAVFPVFALNEQTSQKLSDFNDLANKSALGLQAVKRQVGAAIEEAIQQNTIQKHQSQLQQAKTQDQPQTKTKAKKRALV
ncbi:zincin-like metallopeptidase domain-containing protein [Nitrosomonas marina]|uniref:Antirestriction protein ArdC n=1 Tax=Nitrosomonas marina TaxID=917 RepID=A0A1H8FTM8_9PROT|nr:zincin-like metallopeptidase domain-containing protein [Nitrosomonas marina]SEN34894.1 Antirestriction protein ArdC [Nitrosomonas marina]